jgi:exopolysaccharide production protein ExoZ
MYKTIHACRGFVALLVVLFHLSEVIALPKYFGVSALSGVFSFGNSRMEFFFVLSGFILVWVHMRDFGMPAKLPSYLLKRALRMYPAFWMVFGGVWLLASMSPSLRAQLPDDPWVVTAGLLLLPQDIAIVGGTGAPLLVVAWSLHYEMLFYVVVATAILNRWLALAAVSLLLLNYVTCLQGCAFPRSWLASNYLLAFAAGAGVAKLVHLNFRLNRPRLLIGLATLAWISLTLLEPQGGGQQHGVMHTLGYGAIFSVLLLALVSAEDRGLMTGGGKPLQLLGDSSYALYLIHFPLISAMCKLLIATGLRGAGGAAITFVVILAATIAVSIAFRAWIERPLLRKLFTMLGLRSSSARSTATEPAPNTVYQRR